MQRIVQTLNDPVVTPTSEVLEHGRTRRQPRLDLPVVLKFRPPSQSFQGLAILAE